MSAEVPPEGGPRPAPGARGSYGVDAPRLLAIPGALVVLGLVQGTLARSAWPFLGAALVVVFSGFGFYASRRGKFVVWAGLLDDLGLEGDEQVLDIGCGRGAVLVLAAHRLQSGRAIGVDLWRRRDQSGNGAAATLRNAAVEGVAGQVEVRTADMAALPFSDGTFDVVVSNAALHNAKAGTALDRAINEAVRVLRPGGRLLIADLRATKRYYLRLRSLGMLDVTRRNLGWKMWWSGPWLPTMLVTATKPSV